MMNTIEKILDKRVIGTYYNFIEKTLTISFERDFVLKFYDCAIIFDLGIVGHIVTFISSNSTLGITHELKKMDKDPDDYNFLLISRDIKDYHNKNEILIAYKTLEFKNSVI
ncbi:hypothetical protein OIU80_06010 [Flavobacterium sp. LS1R47]|uniref:Uncharacterized protein n=1 Tax=Flavobacterium frigoritolerans TaxID=2987686 RepID=A0A9X2YYR3_9FLAO|nr:hypothetical protein [Flavobacterium frigoritolerans]MCV9931833.1 hypothetical protein [Flavobacterium frigoritolerans]